MKKKAAKKVRFRRVPKRRPWPLPVRVIALYYATLAILTIIVSRYVSDAEPATRREILLIFSLLWFFHFVVPAALALIYGLVFRPFWEHFLGVLAVIAIVHFLYSAAAATAAHYYRAHRRDLIHQARTAKVRLTSLDQRAVESGGRIERFEIVTGMDFSKLPPGEYFLHARLMQSGLRITDSDIGVFAFSQTEASPGKHSLRWQFEPGPYADYYRRGPVSVQLVLNRFLPLDKWGGVIRNVGRFVPLFRSVTGGGDDIWLRDQVVEVASFPAAQTELPGAAPDYQPLVLRGYLKDFGRDADGDGLFDQLVVPLEVESLYDGTVFLQALVAGAPYPFYHPQTVVRGINRLEFVIDGRLLRDLNLAAPFKFVSVSVTNRDPECAAEPCTPPGRLPFEIFLEDHITERYNLQQFE